MYVARTALLAGAVMVCGACSLVTETDEGSLGHSLDGGPSCMTEVCDNGKDDDCDRAIDAEDSDCAPSNLGESCSSPEPLRGNGTSYGDTTARADDQMPRCAQMSG